MKNKVKLIGLMLLCYGLNVSADDFNSEDITRWQKEFMSSVAEGEKIFHGGLGNENTVSCDQCHPNGTNIHPETYPKFQQQLGKVAVLAEMINWCIENPLESKKLPLDSDKMIAIQAYIHYERRGKELVPGKH